MPALTVNVLIDLPPAQPYNVATIAALVHAATAIGVDAGIRIVPTATIDRDFVRDPGAAVVIGPGTPYRSPDAAHEVVRSARERGVPLVAT